MPVAEFSKLGGNISVIVKFLASSFPWFWNSISYLRVEPKAMLF